MEHPEVLEQVSDSNDAGKDPESGGDPVALLTLLEVPPDRSFPISPLDLSSPLIMSLTLALDPLAFPPQLTRTLVSHDT
jgi:hypothetical protein